jgi:transcriptional regulator with XRE-family HTH domain
MIALMNSLESLGKNLRSARRQLFPNDTLDDFALRIGVSRATLQRMEKGDLSVSLEKYYRAAEVLGLAAPFLTLLSPPKSLFDD